MHGLSICGQCLKKFKVVTTKLKKSQFNKQGQVSIAILR